jgi:hypothetical protein
VLARMLRLKVSNKKSNRVARCAFVVGASRPRYAGLPSFSPLMDIGSGSPGGVNAGNPYQRLRIQKSWNEQRQFSWFTEMGETLRGDRGASG